MDAPRTGPDGPGKAAAADYLPARCAGTGRRRSQGRSRPAPPRAGIRPPGPPRAAPPAPTPPGPAPRRRPRAEARDSPDLGPHPALPLNQPTPRISLPLPPACKLRNGRGVVRWKAPAGLPSPGLSKFLGITCRSRCARTARLPRSGRPSRTGSRALPREESSGMVVISFFQLQTRSESLPQNLQRRLQRPSGPKEVRASTEAKKPELDPALRSAEHTSWLFPTSVFAYQEVFRLSGAPPLRSPR
ncbi:translation initiation factor IF-2-like [Meles meles]|uniref:translation initiation factor IF-2-like n=1 Tax=Meles meles TaxID=9662 RepID=UPI001E6A0E07|nr:translation initiation factor IF-2-like [Meles meles]